MKQAEAQERTTMPKKPSQSKTTKKHATSKTSMTIEDFLTQPTPKFGDNVTPAMLVDELGAAREIKNKAERLEGRYKEALQARLGPKETSVNGDRFAAIIENSVRVSLDVGKIREVMGEEWCEDYERHTPVRTVRTTKHPEE